MTESWRQGSWRAASAWHNTGSAHTEGERTLASRARASPPSRTSSTRNCSRCRHSYLLDGDNLRHGLNVDLGFTPEDRVENVRRAGEVARLMLDAGLIVGAAFISPFRAEREMVRSLVRHDFIEVFVDTPLAVAERRDPKGLYERARRGEIQNFTGIDSPYEAPLDPEMRIDTTEVSPEAASEQIIACLRERGAISRFLRSTVDGALAR